MTNNVQAVCVWKECSLIVSDDRGVIAGVERAGHGRAGEGVETGDDTRRHVHAPKEPQHGHTAPQYGHTAPQCGHTAPRTMTDTLYTGCWIIL